MTDDEGRPDRWSALVVPTSSGGHLFPGRACEVWHDDREGHDVVEGGTVELVRTLVTAAAGSYGANCALGTSAALGWVDTSSFRWVHHALYVSTSSLTAAAVVAGLWKGSTTALALVPTLVPLVLLQRRGARPLPRHTRDALAAAPCYAAGLALAWR